MLIFLLQADTMRWYETPSGAAAIVALISVMITPFINAWIQNRRTKTNTVGHLSDTSLTINAQERREILEQMKVNHEREIAFMQSQLSDMVRKTARQILTAEITEFEARQRAHAYGNECNRLQG